MSFLENIVLLILWKSKKLFLLQLVSILVYIYINLLLSFISILCFLLLSSLLVFITILFVYYIIAMCILFYMSIINPHWKTSILILINILLLYCLFGIINDHFVNIFQYRYIFGICSYNLAIIVKQGLALAVGDKYSIFIKILIVSFIISIVTFIFYNSLYYLIICIMSPSEISYQMSATPYPAFFHIHPIIPQALWIGTPFSEMPTGWHGISGGLVHIVSSSSGFNTIRGISVSVPMPLTFQPHNVFNVHLACLLYEIKQLGFRSWNWDMVADVIGRQDLATADPMTLSSVDWRSKYRIAMYLEHFKDYYGITSNSLHNDILKLLAE